MNSNSRAHSFDVLDVGTCSGECIKIYCIIMCIVVEIVTFKEFFHHYNMVLLIEFGKNNNFTGLEER